MMKEDSDDIYEAAQRGNYAAIESALIKDDGAACGRKRFGRYQETLLHAAARYGQTRVAELLLRKVLAAASAKDSKGRTPLHLACRHHLMKYRLVKRCRISKSRYETIHEDVYCEKKQGSVTDDHLLIVKLLLQQANSAEFLLTQITNKGYTPWHIAVQEATIRPANTSEIVKILTMFCEASSETVALDPKLLHSAMVSNVAVMRYFLDSGVLFDLEARNINGDTPLLHVCKLFDGQLFPILRQLLNAGVSMESRDDFGRTALHYVAERHLSDSATLLITSGADVQASDKSGDTPLHCFVKNPTDPVHQKEKPEKKVHYLLVTQGCAERELAMMLINHGADVNARNTAGTTPLHVASRFGQFENVRMLVEQHADVKAPDEEGDTPLHFLVKNPTNPAIRELVMMLVDRGADVDAQNAAGFAPLHFASTYLGLENVRILVERHNANILVRSNNGSTPLDCWREQPRQYPRYYYGPRFQFADVLQYLLEFYQEQMVEEHGTDSLHTILGQINCPIHQGDEISHAIGTLTVDETATLLRGLIARRPNCLHSRAGNGALPIHVACRKRAPFDLVRFLADQDPNALRTRDGNSSLPIHEACRANLSVESIRFLVEQGGHATLRAQDASGATPLHLLLWQSRPPTAEIFQELSKTVAFLLKQNPDALCVKTMAGDVPVMIACEWSFSEDVIYRLLREHPEALI